MPSAVPLSLTASETSTRRPQVRPAESRPVVDLAVEAEHAIPIGRQHRLGRIARKINDGEARVRKPGAAIGRQPLSFAIRPTMAKENPGSVQCRCGRPVSLDCQVSANTAHKLTLPQRPFWHSVRRHLR